MNPMVYRGLTLIGGLARRARRDQRGLTIVEGAVAGLLLIAGSLGALQIFDAATRNAYRTEESQTISNRLQAELEQIKQLPYGEIALTSGPADNADTNDPRSRISGSQFALSSDGSNAEPLVVDLTDGAVDPAPEPFTIGDVSGDIYKFVVWRDDPSCPENLCPGDQDLKRIVVAARVDEAPISFERSYQEMHTDVVDPDFTPEDDELILDPEEEAAVAQFWLTDTACNHSTRQEIVADHAAHNTRARCSDGLQTGSTQGAPDLMFTEAPAIDPDYPPDGQPLFDYATDAEGPDGYVDKGLLVPWSTNDSCLLQPVLDLLNLRKLVEGTGPLAGGVDLLTNATDGALNLVTDETNKHLRTHTWLSPPIQNDGGVVMTGDATLELWTRTVNGAVHPGHICVWLFVRQQVTVPRLNLLGVPIGSITLTVDLPVVNVGNVSQPTYFEYSQNPWPTQWTEISIPMEFLGVDSNGVLDRLNLTKGSQLGLTVMVKKTGTQPGSALEFMYDHPSYDSRLEVKTENAIQF